MLLRSLYISTPTRALINASYRSGAHCSMACQYFGRISLSVFKSLLSSHQRVTWAGNLYTWAGISTIPGVLFGLESSGWLGLYIHDLQGQFCLLDFVRYKLFRDTKEPWTLDSRRTIFQSGTDGKVYNI